MKIPKSFRMMNRKINVVITNKNDYINHGGVYGYALQDRWKKKNKIIIDKAFGDRTELLIHEFLHHLFDVLDEEELDKNEGLIRRMSRVMTQAINTMEFKKK